MLRLPESMQRFLITVKQQGFTVGTPTEPNAVGVELTTKQAITERIGLIPIAANIDAGIATAVPNPAIPSMKLPNPHPIIRSNTLWSTETLASIFLINSIAPVSNVRLYVNKAATITRQIGHSALSIPSSPAVAVHMRLNFQ